ncbi:MAG: DUF5666 domain-containing protein [Chloroflexota bacterium]
MLLIGSVIQAQDATPQTGASISFDDGVVTEITAEGVVVNGLTILIAPGILDDDTDPIEVGTVLDVDGVLRPDGTVVAVTIDVADDDDNDDDDISVTATADVIETATATPIETANTVTPDASGTPSATPTDTVSTDEFIIVVEGPVQQINVNVITIYNLDIALERDAPALTVIRIGDVVRVEGVLPGDDDNDDDDGDGSQVDLPITVIIAVNITFISVEVIVVDGIIWRDSGDCTNAPPVAVQDAGGGTEWLIRCNQPQASGGNSGGGNSGGGSGGGGGGGGGGDNDDDD